MPQPSDSVTPHSTQPAVAAARAATASLAGLSVLGLALAWHNRFVQDDAFISFVYARHLVEGQGLTWFGTRVEGYTNFLWVLWTALGLRVGAEPIAWSYLGSLSAFALAMYALWRCASLLFDALVPRVVALALFVTNYTVSAYATSGMETMLQTALLCTALWQLFELGRREAPQRPRLAAISVALAAAVLTRMDSLLPAAIVFAAVLVQLVRRRSDWKGYAWAALPFAAIVGSWLGWKAAYYGRVLPNSYYAKVGWSAAALDTGIVYLLRFAHWYLLWPVLLAGAAVMVGRTLLGRSGPQEPPEFLLLWIVIISWCAYVVAVGGDFMEFRFFVPITPWLFLTLAYVTYYPFTTRSQWIPTAAAVTATIVLVAASYRHATTFTGLTADRTLDSVPALATFYGQYGSRDWAMVGTRLRDQLEGAEVSIALLPVGAIPYYSRLTTVDMYGINDLRIPREGAPAPPDYRRPGHQVQATLRYLKERGVNLVIGDPHYIRRGALSEPGNTGLCRRLVRSKVSFSREPIGQATLVAMPIDAGRSLTMWYLTPHSAVDRLISSGQWESQRVYVP
jgi:arabinofuranosyltransferase